MRVKRAAHGTTATVDPYAAYGGRELVEALQRANVTPEQFVTQYYGREPVQIGAPYNYTGFRDPTTGMVYSAPVGGTEYGYRLTPEQRAAQQYAGGARGLGDVTFQDPAAQAAFDVMAGGGGVTAPYQPFQPALPPAAQPPGAQPPAAVGPPIAPPTPWWGQPTPTEFAPPTPQFPQSLTDLYRQGFPQWPWLTSMGLGAGLAMPQLGSALQGIPLPSPQFINRLLPSEAAAFANFWPTVAGIPTEDILAASLYPFQGLQPAAPARRVFY